MPDIFIIVAAAIIGALMLFVAFLIVFFYQHTQDYGTAYFYKILAVLSFSVAFFLVLLLPMDVANTNAVLGGAESIPMDILWQVAFWTGLGVCIGIIPFFMQFYESDEDNIIKRFCYSLIYEIVFLAITVLVLGLCYVFLGIIDVPIYKCTAPLINSTASTTAPCPTCGLFFFELPVRPTLPVYAIAFLSWIGWLLFIVLGGIGMAALPMDLINDWRTRPRDLGKDKSAREKYVRMRTELRERAKFLAEVGKRMKDELRSGRKVPRRDLNRYRAEVFRLDEDNDYFNFYNDNKRSPVVYWIRLVLGVLGSLITFVWIVQILVFMLIDPPLTGLLNDAFIALDSVFPLFGTLFFCLFTFYLLWCVMKGVIKVGARFLIIPLHPMKFKGTRMNSMLFNAGLLIFCCFPLLQFVSDAFASYVNTTAVDVLFGVVARNLMFLKYFFRYNVYLYALICFAFLSFLFLICCTGKAKRKKEQAKEFERLRLNKA